MLGTLLKDRYRIDAKLGEGGMGIVYKAHDTLLNRPVAIKSLTPSLVGAEGLRRLLREAQSAAQLTHPNVVAVYDIIDEEQSRLIVMEYVDGIPLAELLPLEIPRVIDLANQVCRALEYAHSRGVVHRDIKPENIMVTKGNIAKVMDFGLARSEGRSRLTQSGLIVGTVAYMAPEQVLGGTVDARSDLYSLGCVIYEAITGRKPFEGDDPFTVISQQVNVMPVAPRWHNTAITHTLDAIVMRLLAKDPDDRYGSATEVAQALEHVAESDAPAASEPSDPTTRTTLLERIVRSKLVGRAAEVRELREHLDRMVSGEGRLVLISGEPGIGKTRLAEELAVYAHLRGTWVLRGHCYEQDVGVPYLPFMESLRELFHLSAEALMNELGERIDDLARLLPEFKRTQPQTLALTPEDERVHVFDAVAQWVAAASGLHPLVFLLDDLHWADRASLRLLHHLARTVRRERVLIIGTYREMELDLEHPLHDALSQMNRERLFYRLPLRRLSEDDTRALLSGLFDADISRELAGAVYRETEGNPFFIEEVVKALVEESKIYREGGRWRRSGTEELEIPPSVKAVVGRRLQKAGEACRRVLTIAAVIGREFDPDVLMGVSHLEEDAVLDGLDDAVNLHLIRETREGRRASYTFEHALIRQTLYEGLNARRRARLHEEVGEALEALHGTRQDHIEELAYHFGEAGPATASKGIEYNLRAARKAASLYAMEEGERRLAVAMELADAMDDASVLVKVLEALGDLYLLFEDRRATDAYQRALNMLKTQGATASEDALRLYCRVAEASAGWWIEAPAEALLYAQTAVELHKDQPDSPLKARALSLLAMHRARAGDVASAGAHAQQAIDVATRLRDQHNLSMAYRAMAMVYRYRNEWDRFREVVQKRRTLLEAAFTPSDADLYGDIVESYLRDGKMSDAEKASREFLEMAEKLRSPTTIYRACTHLTQVLFYTNAWDEALQVTDRAIVLGDRLHAGGPHTAWVLGYSGEILAARTDEDRARERIAQMEAMRYDIPPEHRSARLAAVMVALSLEDRDLVARLLPRVEQEKPRCLSCAFLFNTVVAQARLRLGDIGGAQAKLDDAQQSLLEAQPWTRGTLPYLQGLIAEAQGNHDLAIKHLEEAVRSMVRPMNLYSARHCEAAGKAYLASGELPDMERGRQLLAEAINFYRMVGARRFEARAMHLLASAGDPA